MNEDVSRYNALSDFPFYLAENTNDSEILKFADYCDTQDNSPECDADRTDTLNWIRKNKPYLLNQPWPKEWQILPNACKDILGN